MICSDNVHGKVGAGEVIYVFAALTIVCGDILSSHETILITAYVVVQAVLLK